VAVLELLRTVYRRDHDKDSPARGDALEQLVRLVRGDQAVDAVELLAEVAVASVRLHARDSGAQFGPMLLEAFRAADATREGEEV
jgi:hypothetical protein